MAFTLNRATDIGKIRVLIPDTVEANAIFQDEDIQVFLDLEGEIKLATAQALETIASNQAFVLKVIELLDLKTDGAKTSDALLKRAKLLRDQAASGSFSDLSAFGWSESAGTSFQIRDRLEKELMREN